MACEIIHGDALEVLKSMEANSADAVVTDPPYGLSFMGKKWDYDVPTTELWAECLRVLKPGGHLLAFAGTRTQHRMAVRIEDAGFEIRDMIAWVYGSGFPKSLDVSKAIDKAAGAEREVIGFDPTCRLAVNKNMNDDGWEKIGQQGAPITAPATDAARQWQGWGTALKPALEPITLARKPLDGTVAANVLAHGTGALNIDGCRVGTTKNVPASVSRKAQANCYGKFAESGETQGVGGHDPSLGRWPANLILSVPEDQYALRDDVTPGQLRQAITKNTEGLAMRIDEKTYKAMPAHLQALFRAEPNPARDEVVALFPDTKGGVAVRSNSGGNTFGGDNAKPPMDDLGYGDSGSAARFFYCAKASKSDRGTGNNHPTVKPTELMRYLVRLVTPPGGKVIDPFSGSGSTGKAAVLEGFGFIGIEREAEYVAIAEARIAEAQRQLGLFA